MIESQYFPFAQNLLLSPWSPLKSCMVISQKTCIRNQGRFTHYCYITCNNKIHEKVTEF